MAAAVEVIDLLSDNEEENLSPSKRNAAAFGARQQERKRTKRADNDVICIDCSDDEEDAAASLWNAVAASSSTNASLGGVAGLNLSSASKTQSTRDNNDVSVVAPPPNPVGPYKTDKSGDDEDVAIVGATGPNALADFPHSRENCVTHPFAKGAARHCPNCYCYVCDVLASSCPAWQTHCHATHGNTKWRKMREDVRKNGGPASLVQAASAAPPTQTTVTNAPPPPPLNVNGRPDLPEYSLTALMQAITCIHPVEATPPAGVFTTTLRHYQKQSLAFMLEAERDETVGNQNRGGWLADELGMGKSAVILALIAANPMPPNKRPSLTRIRQAAVGSPSKGGKTSRLKVKTTVIMTSVSLIGQWEDECRKHAPGLSVARYHPSSNARISYQDLHQYDVIITTSTFKWSEQLTDNFYFHRVVVDESHQFATAPASAKVKFARTIMSGLRWCVTATLFTTGLGDLERQSLFLSTGNLYCRSDALQRAVQNFTRFRSANKKQAFYTLVDELKRCMIRHTKSQRIQGSEALALPPSTTTTIYLDMTPQERKQFAHSHASSWELRAMMQRGSKALNMERAFSFRLGDLTPEQGASLTKIRTLVEDLRQMKLAEPSFRVVVYTQSLRMHDFCVKGLKREGLMVLEFMGSTAAKKRDQAIRSFQSQTDRRPAVFVITLRSGNVGITLTAASRVYLLEPSLDPASEVQAAGRIHRLGQSKPVQVRKLVFRNCVESNIVDLHKEIAAGRIAISNGFFPPEAVKIVAKNIQSAPLSSR